MMESGSQKKIVLTAVIACVVTSVVWMGIGALLYHFWTQSPPAFDVTLTHPDTVEVGEVFTLEIEVENFSSERVSLGSIDLYDDLLDGFSVISLDPKPDSKEHRWGFSTYYFKRSILPSHRFTCKLELEAVHPGYWSGDIDCCTPLENFVTADTGIEVLARSKGSSQVGGSQTQQDQGEGSAAE